MISLVTCTNRPEMIDNIFNNYGRQIYKKKELIIILNRNDMQLNVWKQKAKKYSNVSLFHLPNESLGTCYNFAFAKAKYGYITKFDDDDYYAPCYLLEIMKAFKLTNADIVGKSKFYAYFQKKKLLAVSKNGHEHSMVSWVAGPTITIKKEVFKKVKWADLTGGGDRIFLLECCKHGFKIYSTSKRNFAYVRRNSKNHTWSVSEDQILKWFKIISRTNRYQKMIIEKKQAYDRSNLPIG